MVQKIPVFCNGTAYSGYIGVLYSMGNIMLSWNAAYLRKRVVQCVA